MHADTCTYIHAWRAAKGAAAGRPLPWTSPTHTPPTYAGMRCRHPSTDKAAASPGQLASPQCMPRPAPPQPPDLAVLLPAAGPAPLMPSSLPPPPPHTYTAQTHTQKAVPKWHLLPHRAVPAPTLHTCTHAATRRPAGPATDPLVELHGGGQVVSQLRQHLGRRGAQLSAATRLVGRWLVGCLLAWSVDQLRLLLPLSTQHCSGGRPSEQGLKRGIHTYAQAAKCTTVWYKAVRRIPCTGKTAALSMPLLPCFASRPPALCAPTQRAALLVTAFPIPSFPWRPSPIASHSTSHPPLRKLLDVCAGRSLVQRVD